MAATDADPAFVAFCDAGLWPGLGRTLAAALGDFGIVCPDDVATSTLRELPKVSENRAKKLSTAFQDARPVYEVVELLVGTGLDARLAGRAVDNLGPPAPRLLADDPWLLLHLPGVAPGEADRLARSLIPDARADDPRRSRALVHFVLARQARDGHTVTARDQVADLLREFGVREAPEAIEAALAGGEVLDDDSAQQSDSGEVLLGLARYVQAEHSVADDVERLLATAEPLTGAPDTSDGLDEVQHAAIAAALEHGISVLTGGPGTGKSRTVASLVAQAEALGKTVALAAPTGRAAKRLEALCDAPAMTLHRLLGAQPRSDADGVRFDAGFQRGPDWPLDEDVVVVDETSMLDAELAAALLSACADGTHVLFVGDAAQLPSIGPGRVLGDLIDSGAVPVTELHTLYRQAAGGTIATLATAAREGELLRIDDPTREVVIVPARGSAEAAHRVVQLVTDSIPRALGIAPDQIQVVTPVHRGPAGTKALNDALKAALNPGTGKRRFDPGDRVVATANHLDAQPFGYANGEVGIVDSVEPDNTVVVAFASGPADVSGKALGDLLHGWAITVHRAQGSEFPAVVVVLPPEAGRMLSRPLVYTALTRAQRHLSIVTAAGPAVAHAVRRIGALPRRTLLTSLL